MLFRRGAGRDFPGLERKCRRPRGRLAAGLDLAQQLFERDEFEDAKREAEKALQLAHSSSPVAVQGEVFQDEHGIALGSPVVIAADHFGLEPTEGELVAATRTRYTLRRSDERAGTVHVHFPRVGFTLKKVSS